MDAETTASYDDAGFGRTTSPGSGIGVLVVDMCVAYFDRDSPLDLGQPDIIEAAVDLVGAARSNEVPVLWTRVEFPIGGGGSVWYDKVPALANFDSGSRLGDWLPNLTPANEEVVVAKQHASGFFGTDLAESLRAQSVDTVLICGVSTSGCVRATATDASAHGVVPFVVREAVGDRTDAVNEANLFDLHAKYADVISIDDAAKILSRP